jgi:uncharacterized membrane protein
MPDAPKKMFRLVDRSDVGEILHRLRTVEALLHPHLLGDSIQTFVPQEDVDRIVAELGEASARVDHHLKNGPPTDDGGGGGGGGSGGDGGP